MDALRQINQAKSFTQTQRRVLITIATYIPLNQIGEGWLLKTSTIAADTFGAATPSSLNMTRKALKELEARGCIERVWDGSRYSHNEAATYFINWPEPSVITQLPDVGEDHPIPQLTVVHPTTGS